VPQLTYTIDNAKFQAFKDAFLRADPVPTDDDGNPEMSENDWIKAEGKKFFLEKYKNGLLLLAKDTASVPDNNIIT